MNVMSASRLDRTGGRILSSVFSLNCKAWGGEISSVDGNQKHREQKGRGISIVLAQRESFYVCGMQSVLHCFSFTHSHIQSKCNEKIALWFSSVQFIYVAPNHNKSNLHYSVSFNVCPLEKRIIQLHAVVLIQQGRRFCSKRQYDIWH